MDSMRTKHGEESCMKGAEVGSWALTHKAFVVLLVLLPDGVRRCCCPCTGLISGYGHPYLVL